MGELKMEEIRKKFLEKKEKVKQWKNSYYDKSSQFFNSSTCQYEIMKINDEFDILLKQNSLVRIDDYRYYMEEISFRNIKVGDKLKCISNVKTMDDFGASGLVFETVGFIKNKIYEVAKIGYYGFKKVPYVIDETGCHTFAYLKEFDRI